MTRFRHTAALLLGALLLPMSVSAASQEAEAALTRFVERVETLSADFTQIERDDTGTVLQESTGRFWLQRPGRFRWEVQAPFAQVVVADGETLWHYDPDLAQATRRPAAPALAGTPAELLAEGGGLRERFAIENAEPEALPDGVAAVRLVPDSDRSDFRSVLLHLRDGVPEALFFEDRIGGRTEVRFSAVTVNEAIAESRLRFTPPEGTEVVALE